MGIDWNAVGAIGQWVGAIGTLLAIIFALQQNKPKLKILLQKKPPFYPSLSNFSLIFVAVNQKAIPISIKEASFKTWGGMRLITYNFFGRQLPITLNTSESIEFEVSDNELINELKSVSDSSIILLKFFIMDTTYSFQYKYFFLDIDKKEVYPCWQIWKLLKSKRNISKIQKEKTVSSKEDLEKPKYTLKFLWVDIAISGFYLIMINFASLMIIYYTLRFIESLTYNNQLANPTASITGITLIVLLPIMPTYLLFYFSKEYIIEKEDVFKFVFNFIAFVAALVLLADKYNENGKIGTIFWSNEHFWGIPLTMFCFRVFFDYYLLRNKTCYQR
ncbi:hypothetical protein [Sporomusa aerivorans]|uniref:hypothetical protein n=1 Tax=Sporomusa aerivorans TaxID=204936 RepID=UPI00352A10E2